MYLASAEGLEKFKFLHSNFQEAFYESILLQVARVIASARAFGFDFF